MRASHKGGLAELRVQFVRSVVQRRPAFGVRAAPERGLRVERLEIPQRHADLAHGPSPRRSGFVRAGGFGLISILFAIGLFVALPQAGAEGINKSHFVGAAYGMERASKLAFRTIASAPLMLKGHAIGVISVSAPTPGALSATLGYYRAIFDPLRSDSKLATLRASMSRTRRPGPALQIASRHQA